MRISKKTILIFIFLFPFLEPYYIANTEPKVHDLFIIMKLLFGLIIILKYLKKTKNISKESYNKYIIATIIFWVYIIFNTLIRGFFPVRLYIGAFSVIVVLLYIDINIKYVDNLINALMAHMEILIYINLLLMLLYPRGMYVSTAGNTNNWLLGYDNYFAQTFLPAIGILFIYSY